MTTANPLMKSAFGGRRSPKDPYECADWANTLLTTDQAEIMCWDVVDGQVRLRRLPSGDLVGTPPIKARAA